MNFIQNNLKVGYFLSNAIVCHIYPYSITVILIFLNLFLMQFKYNHPITLLRSHPANVQYHPRLMVTQHLYAAKTLQQRPKNQDQ